MDFKVFTFYAANSIADNISIDFTKLHAKYLYGMN